MNHRIITIAALLAAVSGAAAQERAPLRLEVRPFAGQYVPTGALRDDFKSAPMFGVQSALEISSHMHILASVGWTDGRSKIPTLSKDIAYMWQYDAGVEFNAMQELGYDWVFRPFVGAGAGARTYDYQASGVGKRSCAAGYSALGAEFQKQSIALRFESRGYVTCFKSPLSVDSKFRSDLNFALGFAYHIF